MADETPPKSPAPPPIVDLDAGQNFGRDSLTLLRPFKYKGMTYTAVSFRVPNGFDVQKHIGGRAAGYDGLALMADLCELSTDVFDVMYAGDRNRVDQAVGKHLQGVPPTSTTSSTTSGSAIPGVTSAS